VDSIILSNYACFPGVLMDWQFIIKTLSGRLHYPNSEQLPSDFNCYRKDRSTGEGGGVFILVSKKYESEEPEELKVDKN
jgi:hypothetical protein